jgi:hypothetical protein
MRLMALRGARRGACALLAAIGSLSCGSGSPSTPDAVAPTPILETRVGTVGAHRLAFVDFSMTRAGVVTLKVDPVLLLTLRSGKGPADVTGFITNSDNGGLTAAAPAGTNSVVIGNPFDTDRAFTLSIVHP